MEPVALFDHWTTFARPLRSAAHVCILSDFDGTLAPLADSPGAALLPPATRSQLQRLASSPRATLAIVSGRGVGDLRRKVDIDNAWYGGMHGFEIRNPRGRERRWYTSREVRRISALAEGLERALARVPGAMVERKGAGVAVHFRRVRRVRVREVQEAVLEAWRREGRGLTFGSGLEVLELMPAGTRTKGTAVRFILGRIRAGALPVYFGDDITDVDAFRALAGIGIRVGVGDGVSRHLDYRVKDPSEVAEALRRIAALLESR